MLSIRWTLEQAAAEFGLNPRTVSQRIKKSGILPGEDGFFSTTDIHDAICTATERLKAGLLAAQKEAADRENAAARGQLVDKVDFLKRLERVHVAMKQKVMTSSMSDAEKDALLQEFANCYRV